MAGVRLNFAEHLSDIEPVDEGKPAGLFGCIGKSLGAVEETDPSGCLDGILP